MNRLKQLRESKGMTQQELADLVGVLSRTVRRWEQNANESRYVKPKH